jgi:hypothetical protein
MHHEIYQTHSRGSGESRLDHSGEVFFSVMGCDDAAEFHGTGSQLDEHALRAGHLDDGFGLI